MEDMDTFGGLDFPENSSSNPPLPPAQTKTPEVAVQKTISSLKVPRWGWVLIGFVAIIMITAAILVPIFLLNKKSNSSGPPTISFPVSTSSSPKVPMVPPGNIIFQTEVPNNGGLVKSAVNITDVNESEIGFVEVGRNDRSVFYVTSLANGVVSNPVFLVSDSSFSTWVSVYGQQAVYSQFPLSEDMYFNCSTSIDDKTVACSSITWKQVGLINQNFFLSTRWNQFNNVDITFSFSQEQGGQFILTVQDDLTVYTGLQRPLEGVSYPLEESIISMFGSYNQTYVTFGFAERLTNTIYYVTYLQDNSTRPVQKLVLDPTGESMVNAVSTNDSTRLVVLTSQRLLLYTRNLEEGVFDFSLADSYVLNTSQIVPITCAVDVSFDQTDAQELWCSVGGTRGVSLIISVNTSINMFDDGRARLVPTKKMKNTSGPMAVQLTGNNGKLFLVCSDNTGLGEMNLISTSTL